MFRPRTLKVHAQSGAEPAPFSAGHRRREWFGKVRLERAKGFEPSTPTSARLEPGVLNDARLGHNPLDFP